MAVPRLAHTVIRGGEKYRGRAGLAAFLGGGAVEVSIYRSTLAGLLVQEPGSDTLYYVGEGDRVVFRRSYEELCHWHNGPLDKPDDPLKRKYCVKPAYTQLGYCREHSDSLRAHYSRCLSTAGAQGRSSCLLIDKRVKTSYSIYLASYRHGLKVGVTRTWRLHNRLAEQPHAAATELARTNSIAEARSLEEEIGRMPGFTERPHKRGLAEALEADIAAEAERIRAAAERIARRLGLRWEGDVFSVRPRGDLIPYYRRARIVDPFAAAQAAEIIDYWGGHLLVYMGNEYRLVKTKPLLHMDTLIVKT